MKRKKTVVTPGEPRAPGAIVTQHRALVSCISELEAAVELLIGRINSCLTPTPPQGDQGIAGKVMPCQSELADALDERCANLRAIADRVRSIADRVEL